MNKIFNQKTGKIIDLGEHEYNETTRLKTEIKNATNQSWFWITNGKYGFRPVFTSLGKYIGYVGAGYFQEV